MIDVTDEKEAARTMNAMFGINDPKRAEAINAAVIGYRFTKGNIGDVIASIQKDYKGNEFSFAMYLLGCLRTAKLVILEPEAIQPQQNPRSVS